MDTEQTSKTSVTNQSNSGVKIRKEPAPDPERESLLCEAILDSLAPALINDREGQIVKSYSKTFEWIFDPEQHGFARWLCDDSKLPSLAALSLAEKTSNPIFWISGSPGSGKSTLMRHIHQSPDLLHLLRQWTKGKEVTIATFFFWESGTVMQRSRAGLLRALVHQLLDRHPELLPSAMPDLWSHIWTASTVERVRLLAAWDEEELESIVVRYFKIPGRPPTYLHIDGLDELEGDQEQLIGLIKRISTCGDIKICVSSRPWDIFDASFRDVPSLKLQDLTKDDMRRFVRGQLSSEPRLAALLNEYSDQGQQLEEVILQKAAGVFLWVSLAVADISRSIDSAKAYSIDDLQEHVEKLPIGLNNFYRYRLIKHPPSSITMSRIFQFLGARQEIAAFTRDNDTSLIKVWEMSLLNEAISIDEIAEMQIHRLSRDDVEFRCNEATDNVHRATASLVQVQQSDLLPKAASGVTYIHRTVKDWLADPLVWNEVVGFAPDVNPHLAHLRSVVLSFRLTAQKPRRQRTVLDWWSRVVLAITHARYIPGSSEDACKLLDTLNDTLTWYYFPTRDPDPRVDHWARSYFGTLEERGQTPYEQPFLALAVKFGLVDYVKHHLKLGRYHEKVDAGKSILLWSTMYLLNRQSSLYPLSNLEMVDVLLEHGLNPNHRAEHIVGLGQKSSKKQRTPWEATLECVQQGQRRGWIDMEEHNVERWTGILQTFVRHGADPGVEVCATYKDKTESAIVLMERVRNAHPCPALKEVCENLRVRLNK